MRFVNLPAMLEINNIMWYQCNTVAVVSGQIFSTAWKSVQINNCCYSPSNKNDGSTERNDPARDISIQMDAIERNINNYTLIQISITQMQFFCAIHCFLRIAAHYLHLMWFHKLTLRWSLRSYLEEWNSDFLCIISWTDAGFCFN